jgi:hypothetical protein
MPLSHPLATTRDFRSVQRRPEIVEELQSTTRLRWHFHRIHKGYIDKSEQDLINGPPGFYNLTQFYKNVLVNSTMKPATVDTPLHKLETHAASIGDYTIRTCA